MAQIIATIRVGYHVTIAYKTYTVLGVSKLRGTYKYILRAPEGHKVSISREAVLAGQTNGTVKVVA